MTDLLASPPTTIDLEHGEEVAVDVDQLLETLSEDELSELDGALAVRALLLEMRRGRRDAERLRRLRDAVAIPYEMRLDALSQREQRVREVLDDFLRRSGTSKVSLPDVGCAYLTTRRAGGKLRITDPAEFEQVLETLQLSAQQRDALYSRQLDRARVLELAERLYAATADGKLVDRETGEILDEVPGVAAEPEACELAVRIDG